MAISQGLQPVHYPSRSRQPSDEWRQSPALLDYQTIDSDLDFSKHDWS